MPVTPLLVPVGGLPPVAHTPDDFAEAARRLARGRGPFAIDTERASDYRCDDRAFLVQIKRRDAGTFLLAPEGHREELSRHLSPVLTGQEWVLHAAASDLPSLQLLGLRPGRIFDTEIGGRLLGLPKVNLAALTEDVLDLGLEKNHGNEDWSTWPLPAPWLTYAALDVEVLLELAEALTELLDSSGKLHWLEQECAHIQQNVHIPRPHWRDLKGIGKLRSPRQLAIARSLWTFRYERAQDIDRAPHRILPNKALIELARTAPTSGRDIRAVLGRRPTTALVRSLHKVILATLAAPPATWPEPMTKDYNHTPAPRSSWSTNFPEAQGALDAVREGLAEMSLLTGTPQENILQPAMLREIIWACVVSRKLRFSADLPAFMDELGVRPWQQELSFPLLADTLF